MRHFADILGVGISELVVILFIILLLIGGTRLPALLRSVGSSVRELRRDISNEAQSDSPAASSKKF